MGLPAFLSGLRKRVRLRRPGHRERPKEVDPWLERKEINFTSLSGQEIARPPEIGEMGVVHYGGKPFFIVRRESKDQYKIVRIANPNRQIFEKMVPETVDKQELMRMVSSHFGTPGPSHRFNINRVVLSRRKEDPQPYTP